jgi:hypothetical protein
MMAAPHHTCMLTERTDWLQADAEFERERCNRLLEQQSDTRQQVGLTGSSSVNTSKAPYLPSLLHVSGCVWCLVGMHILQMGIQQLNQACHECDNIFDLNIRMSAGGGAAAAQWRIPGDGDGPAAAAQRRALGSR